MQSPGWLSTPNRRPISDMVFCHPGIERYHFIHDAEYPLWHKVSLNIILLNWTEIDISWGGYLVDRIPPGSDAHDPDLNYKSLSFSKCIAFIDNTIWIGGWKWVTSPKVTEYIEYVLAKCNTVNSIIGASEPLLKWTPLKTIPDIRTVWCINTL